MSVAVVVVAAGAGNRLGAGLPKALVTLRDRTILDWSLRAFVDHPDIDWLVVVAPAASTETIAATAHPSVLVVPGGASRQESVRRGLAAVDSLAAEVEFVLVHDAARPLVPATVISAVVAALRDGADAVIPVLPVIDTIKRVDGAQRVTDAVDRSELRRVQTPQGFRLAVLRQAHEAGERLGSAAITDDAGLIEALGHPVGTVAGDEAAFKITTPYDLRLAELLVAR
ncbi:MAG: 2-C-methyl-D-erythritol 4-phosphate cytidylyltransferase [Actinomycetota bacterium]|nr:2-C-methyl-D-erythritol 4-phosphate cytidylyltransferase [Actinomycetota bacterium]MDQ2958160.1 2-C-methyl-D-erythritol 4-phosphate cytidylyltransferase [Actinomycetota bacterium]